MIRRLLAVVGALAIAGALSIPAQAQSLGPFDFANATGGGSFSRVIEKQNPWPQPDPSLLVVNPGGIGTWDINDYYSYQAAGSLAEGTSASTTWQHVFDWDPIYRCVYNDCRLRGSVSNRFGALAQSRSAALSGSVCYEPQARCFALMAIWDAAARLYDYQSCSQAVYTDGDPAIVDILGSNGGRGVPTTITLTITNPTARSVRSVSVGWGISSDVNPAPGCNNQTPNVDYPFRWSP